MAPTNAPRASRRRERVAAATTALARVAGLGGSAEPVGLALSRLRWVVVATMLLVAVAWAEPGRTGHPIWLSVFAFAAYNLAVEVARHRVPRLRSFGWVPLADLPAATLLYAFNHEPGGPLFVAFFLTVLTAAAVWSVRATALYTALTAAAIVVVAPTLPDWSATPENYRQLVPRVIVLVMVGVGTAQLTRRLATQEETARVLSDEAARLEELDRLRGEFVASVSHDLRTPLTAAQAALGFLAMGAADRLGPDERTLLANARRNIERLGVLIDDLLTSTQLEAGVLRLTLEPLDLRAVVADAMSAVHPLLRQKGQTLEVTLPDPLPVMGDARRLEHVVVNLLGNAHKHTQGGARVAIEGRCAAGEVLLAISDDGPGIPAGDAERVFERFYQRGTAGGSGLGLANARGIVALHGGRIWAEDGPGGGAVFRIALPLRQGGNQPWASTC